MSTVHNNNDKYRHVQSMPRTAHVPKVALLIPYCWLPFLFEIRFAQANIIAGSFLVFPLSRTVVMCGSEDRSKQLFRQRPPA